jgi:hypothetical protein
VILIIYYNQTAKAKALYVSTNGSAWLPANNLPNSGQLRDFYQIIPDLAGLVY